MQKVKPTTKEQLIYYMIQNISLGTYDKRFLTNVQQLNIVLKKPTTSNQSLLLDKIVARYRKQLVKQELTVSELLALPWNTEPIESLPQYTEAFVSIEEEQVVVRSPYKSEFVKEFRDYKYSTWNKETKTWTTPMSEEILKHVIDVTIKHYDHVNFCDEVKAIVNTLSEYSEDMYWQPTLVQVNGLLLIAATNSSLDNAIKHIELSLEPACIARLAFHGIALSDELKKLSTDIEFAVARNIPVEFNADLLLSHIDNIKPDFVLLTDWFGVQKDFTERVRNGLFERSIKYIIFDRRKSNMQDTSLRGHELPIIITSWSFSSNSLLADTSAKTINLVNNNPIRIK